MFNAIKPGPGKDIKTESTKAVIQFSVVRFSHCQNQKHSDFSFVYIVT